MVLKQCCCTESNNLVASAPHRATFQQVSPQPVQVHGVILSQVQNAELAFGEFQKVQVLVLLT